MATKKRRLERRKRDHPKVEQYMALSHLASSLATLAKQEQQYIALLRQVAALTEHETTQPEKQWFIPEFEYSDDVAGDILDYVDSWLQNIMEHSKIIEEKRDKALEGMRQADTLDNDSLKDAALQLTEHEAQFSIIQQVQIRWSKIVRHKDETDLQQHTSKWMKRWLAQWKKLNVTTQQRLNLFRESLKAPFLRVSEEATHN